MPHRRSSSNVIARFEDLQPFRSRADVTTYLDNEKLECLICGKKFSSLSNHLPVHGISLRAYKEKLNLPLRRGLIGTSLRALHAASAANMPIRNIKAMLDGAAKYFSRGKGKGVSQYARLALSEITPFTHKKNVARVRADMVRCLWMCERGDSVAKLAVRSGVARHVFYSRLKTYPDIKAAFEELRR